MPLGTRSNRCPRILSSFGAIVSPTGPLKTCSIAPVSGATTAASPLGDQCPIPLRSARPCHPQGRPTPSASYAPHNPSADSSDFASASSRFSFSWNGCPGDCDVRRKTCEPFGEGQPPSRRHQKLLLFPFPLTQRYDPPLRDSGQASSLNRRLVPVPCLQGYHTRQEVFQRVANRLENGLPLQRERL